MALQRGQRQREWPRCWCRRCCSPAGAPPPPPLPQRRRQRWRPARGGNDPRGGDVPRDHYRPTRAAALWRARNAATATAAAVATAVAAPPPTGTPKATWAAALPSRGGRAAGGGNRGVVGDGVERGGGNRKASLWVRWGGGWGGGSCGLPSAVTLASAAVRAAGWERPPRLRQAAQPTPRHPRGRIVAVLPPPPTPPLPPPPRLCLLRHHRRLGQRRGRDQARGNAAVTATASSAAGRGVAGATAARRCGWRGGVLGEVGGMVVCGRAAGGIGRFFGSERVRDSLSPEGRITVAALLARRRRCAPATRRTARRRR